MVLHPEAGVSLGAGIVAAAVAVVNDRKRVSSTIATATCSPRALIEYKIGVCKKV